MNGTYDLLWKVDQRLETSEDMKHDDTVFEGIKIIDKVDDTPAANGVT